MIGEPQIDRAGDIGFGHDEVVRRWKALHTGVRQPAREVGREVVVEDRVGCAPSEQHGYVEVVQACGDVGQRSFGGVSTALFERDVADEIGDRGAAQRRRVGRSERGPVGPADLASGEQRRAVDEDGSPTTNEVAQRRRCSEPDDRRRLAAGGHGDAGVAQHHAVDSVGVVDGPAHRDGATPVVRGEHERDGGVDAEGVDHVIEVGDAGCVSAQRRALAEAHSELIDRDHPVAVTEGAQEGRP